MKSINNIIDYYENRTEITSNWRVKKQEELKKRVFMEFKKFDKTEDIISKIEDVYIIQVEDVLIEEKVEVNVFPELKDLKKIQNIESNANDHYKSNGRELNTEYITEVIIDAFMENGTEWVSFGTNKLYKTFEYAGRQPLTYCMIKFYSEFYIDLSNSPLLFHFLKTWREYWDENAYDEIGRKAVINAFPEFDKIINDIHTISTHNYEGIINQGFMLIANHTPSIKLEEKISITEHKRFRKLLQITNNETILLLEPDSYNAYGFILNISPREYNGYLINFRGSLSWNCKRGEYDMFHFENMQARLPYSNEYNIQRFKKVSSDVFPDITEKGNTFDLVEEATKQKHGTMLVIIDDEHVQKEAKRLSVSSTLIVPIPLNKIILSRLTEIDGAVLLNPSGICYSIGVILDGPVVNGDPGRGARYNSALRYRKSLKDKNIKGVIVIVSEDGYVTTITTNEME